MSQNSESTAEAPDEGQNFPDAQEKAVSSFVSAAQIPASDSTPFVSRFNQWIKVIAIVVLAAFVPDQISWAFGYNPAVLYKSLPVYAMDENMLTSKPVTQVAGSLEYLLKQIQNKPKLRLELNLDSVPSHSVGRAREGGHSLEIDTKSVFTVDKINQITQWLKTPNLNVLNCGVYALKDVLEANGIKRSLEEISVMTLSVDIMADIIKVGEPKLKTTLFAINKTAKALGLDYESLKLAPIDTLNLKTPFIAHFKNEHFVTVQKAVGGKVYYTDLDYPHIVDQQDFLNNADGYVFAQFPPPGGEGQGGGNQLHAQVVPEALQAFVWGDKWRDRSGSLPGLMTTGQILLQLVLMVVQIAIPGLGIMKESVQMAEFSMELGQVMSSLATICVMKKACSPDQAFILSTALTMAISMGVSAANAAYDVNSIRSAATKFAIDPSAANEGALVDAQNAATTDGLSQSTINSASSAGNQAAINAPGSTAPLNTVPKAVGNAVINTGVNVVPAVAASVNAAFLKAFMTGLLFGTLKG